MEVDSTFDSSSDSVNIKIDGIDLDAEHLKRNELVGKCFFILHRFNELTSCLWKDFPVQTL
jgi:hypothetical protein